MRGRFENGYQHILRRGIVIRFSDDQLTATGLVREDSSCPHHQLLAFLPPRLTKALETGLPVCESPQPPENLALKTSEYSIASKRKGEPKNQK
jgi:hypothetical protein